jgi:hypothetical protein
VVRYAKAILAAVLMGCLTAGAQDVFDKATQLTDRGDFQGAAVLLLSNPTLTNISDYCLSHRYGDYGLERG